MFNDARTMEIVFWALLGLVAVMVVLALFIISKYEKHLKADEEERKKALEAEEEREKATESVVSRSRRGERVARRTRSYRGK
jgi:cell division protein FtsL